MIVPDRSAARPRERILAIASELFYREGIRAVGVDTIVARAGVAKMTLYHHFPSKDALIAACLRQQGELWRSWFEAAVERRTEQPRERLIAIFDALAEWVSHDDFRGCPFINAAAELADDDHPAREVVLEHTRQLQAYLHRLTAAAGAPDPDRLAVQLLLLVQGAIVLTVVGGAPDAVQQARQTAELVIGAH